MMRTSNRTLDPMLIDIGKRDQDFLLYYGDQPLRTAGHHEYNHRSDRLLRMIMMEIFDHRCLRLDEVSAAMLFEIQRDRIEGGKDLVQKNLDLLMDADPFIAMKVSGKGFRQVFESNGAFEGSGEQDHSMISLFWSVSSLLGPLNEYISRMMGRFEIHDGGEDPVLHLVRNAYAERSKSEKAVLQVLCFGHRAGIMLPLLWIMGSVNSYEYLKCLSAIRANGLLAKMERVAKASRALFGTGWMAETDDPAGEEEQLRRDLGVASDFLSVMKASSGTGHDLSALISAGESATLEFKSTLRWDLRAGKTNPAIERASLKTISAFLNTDGGILLIGVRDDGSIEGIESDKLANDDKFLLHFWTLVRTCFGREVSPYIRTDLVTAGEKTVCIVTCSRCDYPVFLNQPGFPEEFYIRVGPSSNALAVSEALKYIGDRFPVMG